MLTSILLSNDVFWITSHCILEANSDLKYFIKGVFQKGSPAYKLRGYVNIISQVGMQRLKRYTFIHIRNKLHWVMKHYYELQNTERGGIRRQ